MQHDEFIGHVQHRARLDSRGAAERATRATLETLGSRIPDGLAGNLAAQLPAEIGDHLRVTPAVPAAVDRFDRHEFVRRVAETESVDEPVAAYHARVVLEVVDEGTQGGTLDKICEVLPGDLAQSVRAGSTD